MNDHGSATCTPPLVAKAKRSLTKARDAFFEKRYEETVERCQEALTLFLPQPGTALPTPEECGDLFLQRWGAHIQLSDAEGIAGVFTFFVRRKEQFRYERGRPLPRREWWQLLQISREEAAAVLGAAQRALEAVKRGLAASP